MSASRDRVGKLDKMSRLSINSGIKRSLWEKGGWADAGVSLCVGGGLHGAARHEYSQRATYARGAGMLVNALVSVKPLMRTRERTRFSLRVASANFCARNAPSDAPQRWI